MLESLLSDILLRYLGAFVKDLNSEKLKVAVWSGLVELRNVELKREAINAIIQKQLNLPVSFQQGIIGKLSLSVPWSNLRTKPVVLTLDQLCILLGPPRKTASDVEEEKLKLRTSKQRQLSKIIIDMEEKRYSASFLDGSCSVLASTSGVCEESGEIGGENNGLWEQLMTKALDNVQVSINDITIRYEGTEDQIKNCICGGLSIESISMQNVSPSTTTETTSTSTSMGSIKKVVKLANIIAYLSPGELPLKFKNADEFLKEMCGIASRLTKEEIFLVPTSCSLILDISKGNKQKISVDASSESIAFNVTKSQIQTLVSLLEQVDISQKRMKYSTIPRPQSSVSSSPKEWWSYVYKCISIDIKSKREHLSSAISAERIKTKTTYIELLKLPTKTNEDTEKLLQIEDQLSIPEILYYRALAEKDLSEKKTTINAPQKQRFFGRLMNLQSSIATRISNALMGDLTQDQRATLYAALEYSPQVEEQHKVKDSSLSLSFICGSLSISFHDSSTMISNFSFSGFALSSIWDKMHSSVSAQLKDILVITSTKESNLIHKDPQQVVIRSCIHENEQILTLKINSSFENSSIALHTISATFLPIDIVLTPSWLLSFGKFVDPLIPLICKYLSKTSLSDYSAEARSSYKLDLSLQVPKLHFPSEKKSLIFDFGTLKIASFPASARFRTSSTNAVVTKDTQQESYFDHFEILLSDLQALIVGTHEEKEVCVDPLTLKIKFDRSPFQAMHTAQPAKKLEMKISPLGISFNLAHYAIIGNFVDALTLFVAGGTTIQQEILSAKEEAMDSFLMALKKEEKISLPWKPITSQQKLLIGEISLEESRLTVLKEKDNRIACLALSGFFCSITQRPFDTQASLRLISISLRDLISGTTILDSLSSDALVPLIKANVLSCVPKSPLFVAERLRVDVEFNILSLVVCKDSLLALVFLSKDQILFAVLLISFLSKHVFKTRKFVPHAKKFNRSLPQLTDRRISATTTIHVNSFQAKFIQSDGKVSGIGKIKDFAIVYTQRTKIRKITVLVGPAIVMNGEEQESKPMLIIGEESARSTVFSLEKQHPFKQSTIRFRVGEIKLDATARFWILLFSQFILPVKKFLPKSEHKVEVFLGTISITIPGKEGCFSECRISNVFFHNGNEKIAENNLTHFRANFELSLLFCSPVIQARILDKSQFSLIADTTTSSTKVTLKGNPSFLIYTDYFAQMLDSFVSSLSGIQEITDKQQYHSPHNIVFVIQCQTIKLSVGTSERVPIITSMESSNAIIFASFLKETKIGFSADSLSLFDTRGSKKTILSCGSQSSENSTTSSIVFWATCPELSNLISVAIQIDTLAVEIVPNFFFEMKDLGSSVLKNLPEIDNAFSSPSTTSNASNRKICEFTGSVTGFSASFPQEDKTSSLIFRLNTYIKYSQKTSCRDLSALLENVGISRTTRHSRQHRESSGQQLLRPFDVSLKWVHQTDNPASLTISLSALRFSLSPQDIYGVGNFIDTNFHISDALANSKEKSFLSRLPSTQIVTIKTCGLRAMLLDDREGRSIPILKLKCQSFECTAKTADNSYLVASAQILWKADFFNITKATWEPLLEPWECKLEFAKSSGDPQDMTIALSSPMRANFNITQALFTTLRDETPWIIAKKSRSSSTTPYSPIVLNNLSGILLQVSSSKEEDSWTNVEPGYEFPIQHKSHKKKKAVLNVKFEGFTQKHSISYDKIKSAELPLTPSDFEEYHGQSTQVTLSLSFSNGSKVITLRSPVIVENKCPVPISFRVQRGQSILFSSESLAPGKQFGLSPVLLYGNSTATISTKLSSDDSNSWALLPIELSRLPLGTRIVPIKTETYQFNARITSGCVQNSKNQYHTISFSAPLVLENFLPEVAKFEIIAAGKPCFQGTLESGETTAIYKLEHQQQADMFVTIPGFTCLHSVAITSETKQSKVKLQREKDKPLNIDVEIAITEEQSRKISFFSKYWIVNATGLQAFFFSVINGRKTPIPTQHSTAISYLPQPSRGTTPWELSEQLRASAPIIFCPEEQGADNQTFISFKISGSKMSTAFDIDSVGVPREITIVEEKRPMQELRHVFSFGVSIGFGSGKFSRTKVVTVSPRIFLCNHCPREIYYKQLGLGSNLMFTLPPEASLPFHWPHKDGTMLLSVSLAPTSEFGCWSGGFSISDLGRFCLRVPSTGFGQETISEFLWVDVVSKGASILVSLSPCPKTKTAYRIDNNYHHRIVVSQTTIGVPVNVSPKSSEPFAWDEPTKPKRKLVISVLSQTAPFEFPKPINIDKIGSVSIVKTGSDQVVRATVKLEGSIKVLLIEGVPLSAISEGRSNSPAPPVSPRSSGSDTVSRPSEMPIIGYRFSFVINLHGIGISIINSLPKELMYCSMDNISVKYQANLPEESFTFLIENAQIDNQLHITQYPVLLCPTTDRSKQTRILSIVAIKSKQYEGVRYFKYLAALIGEFNLSVDEALLNYIIDFLTSGKPKETEVLETAPSTTSTRSSTSDKVIYFELLHFNPVKCNFSFATRLEEQASSITNPLREMLGGMSLLSTEMVPITLSALMLEHPFYETGQFAVTLAQYYKSQLLRQLYNIVLRLDCIGAPLMLWNFCGKGLIDFFYEPAAGFVKSPDEFARGLSKGAQSFIRNSVVGIFNSGRRLLGTIGKGVASLSMDQDYQRGHMLSSAKDPKHFGEGLLFGAKDFGKGVVRGFAGVVTEPIRGAQRDGLSGFVRGLGLGMVGVAVKPTVGVIDMAAQTAKGIINTATFFDAKPQRVRPPRHFGPDGILQPFDEASAIGQNILSILAKGKFSSESYELHSDKLTDEKTVLISHTRIFIIHYDDERPQIDWTLGINDIAKIEKDESACEIRLYVRQQQRQSTEALTVEDGLEQAEEEEEEETSTSRRQQQPMAEIRNIKFGHYKQELEKVCSIITILWTHQQQQVNQQ